MGWCAATGLALVAAAVGGCAGARPNVTRLRTSLSLVQGWHALSWVKAGVLLDIPRASSELIDGGGAGSGRNGRRGVQLLAANGDVTSVRALQPVLAETPFTTRWIALSPGGNRLAVAMSRGAPAVLGLNGRRQAVWHGALSIAGAWLNDHVVRMLTLDPDGWRMQDWDVNQNASVRSTALGDSGGPLPVRLVGCAAHGDGLRMLFAVDFTGAFSVVDWPGEPGAQPHSVARRDPADGGRITAPCLSPDGGQIAFLETALAANFMAQLNMRLPGNSGYEWTTQLIVRNVASGAERVLYTTPPVHEDSAELEGLTWSPDGRYLLTTRFAMRDINDRYLFVVAADPGTPKWVQ